MTLSGDLAGVAVAAVTNSIAVTLYLNTVHDFSCNINSVD
jgi:hypothetical protein